MATTVNAVVSEEALRDQIRTELDAEYREKLQEDIKKFRETIRAENTKAMEQVIADYRKKMEPPKPEDIQKLLEQEYLTFKIELPYGKGKRAFTITELPQAIERKFYARLKTALLNWSAEAEGMKLNLEGADTFKKVLGVLNQFEPMLDVLAYAATLALNPRGEEEGIDEEWVSKNLSSERILQIVNAQVMCNRMRDFFSLLSSGLRLTA